MKRSLRINKSYLPAVLVLIGLSLALLAMACGGNEPRAGTLGYKAWDRVFQDASKGEDVCGATIKRNKYADFEDDQGWDVDHIVPPKSGGSRTASANLRPMQRQNNIAKGNARDPNWICKEGDRAGQPPF